MIIEFWPDFFAFKNWHTNFEIKIVIAIYLHNKTHKTSRQTWVKVPWIHVSLSEFTAPHPRKSLCTLHAHFIRRRTKLVRIRSDAHNTVFWLDEFAHSLVVQVIDDWAHYQSHYRLRFVSHTQAGVSSPQTHTHAKSTRLNTTQRHLRPITLFLNDNSLSTHALNAQHHLHDTTHLVTLQQE